MGGGGCRAPCAHDHARCADDKRGPPPARTGPDPRGHLRSGRPRCPARLHDGGVGGVRYVPLARKAGDPARLPRRPGALRADRDRHVGLSFRDRRNRSRRDSRQHRGLGSRRQPGRSSGRGSNRPGRQAGGSQGGDRPRGAGPQADRISRESPSGPGPRATCPKSYVLPPATSATGWKRSDRGSSRCIASRSSTRLSPPSDRTST